MNTDTTRNRTGARQSFVAAAMVALFLMFVALPALHADDRTRCQKDTEKAEMKLDEAIRTHGGLSHEAAVKMEDLRKQREHCYDRFHEWWDGREQRWHDDNDFGQDLHNRDHDHDHDHDHPDRL